ncbi:MAG: ferritin-like domain-containing protein [Gammaproteobacteria bacterium]
MNRRKINHLLRTELSAVETYQRALGEKEWKLLHGDPELPTLFHILVDHIQAASQLGKEIERLNAPPGNGAHAWGMGSNLGTESAKLFSDANLFGSKAGLRALKESEESALQDYRGLLRAVPTPSEMRPLIDNLIAKQQAHVKALEALMVGNGTPFDRNGRSSVSNTRS